jgi:4-aminobutyrate aminotransferase / (S)-3-amino-2-methylpropionate transaminase / 5-aminovalerate transaminase
MTERPTGLPQERRIVTELPGPRSRELAARRAAAVPRGMGTTMPVFAARAGGGVVEDVDGNVFVDFGAGIAVTNVGSSSPDVVRAIREQAEAFTHTCAMITPYEGYVAVCEELNRRTPGGHEKRSMLVNSGAEAVENAVKVARSATGRPAVVTFEHAFHGRTLLTMTLTAKLTYKQGFGPYAPEVYRLPFSYPYRCPTGAPYDACAESCAAAAIDKMTREIGPGAIAALVVEPVLGEGGVVVPGEGFLPTLAAFCREHGILLVADEVQTGFGRTGAWFASEHEGLEPDIVTTAKGIAGGLPLAGVTGRAELMDAVHPGGLGGTFGGNPVACAAALATIAQIERDGLVERAGVIGERLLGRLRALQRTYDVIGDVRGRGAMVGLELVRPGTRAPAPDVAGRLLAACHAEGLLLLRAGTYDNVVRIIPPLVISDELVDDGLSVIEKALATL